MVGQSLLALNINDPTIAPFIHPHHPYNRIVRLYAAAHGEVDANIWRDPYSLPKFERHPEPQGRLLNPFTSEQIQREKRHVISDWIDHKLTRKTDFTNLMLLRLQISFGVTTGPQRFAFFA